MANLRGSTYDKQVRDAFHRLERFGVGRHGRDDHATHSLALAKKREMYLRDFRQYAENMGLSGKLNQLMGREDMLRDFLTDRLAGLAAKTAEDYVAGWSSMIQGLREANITVSDQADRAIEHMRTDIKSWDRAAPRVDRTISRPDQVVEKMYEIKRESGVIAQIQRETGFRTSEAYRLARDPEKYLHDGKVEGMIGKGNHQYGEKPISRELREELRRIDPAKIPSPRTYTSHLREASGREDTVPHDWRYTYARERMEEKLACGKGYGEAAREVSREMNHHREDMTQYYISRS